MARSRFTASSTARVTAIAQTHPTHATVDRRWRQAAERLTRIG
ncbi:MAG: hypothetical protein R5N74_07810 [Cutibacterium granulosum]|nr:hypothetical protein [Cutibacterium granulosum]